MFNPQRDELIKSKKDLERTLVHLRMQLDRAKTTPPFNLNEKIATTEKKIAEIQILLDNKGETQIVVTKTNHTPWWLLILALIIVIFLLMVAVMLDWTSAIQGIIFILLPPLAVWLFFKLRNKTGDH